MFRKFRSQSKDVEPNPDPDLSSQGFVRALSSDPFNSNSSVLLHGSLSIHVVEARHVETKSKSIFGKLERAVTSSIDGVDPYCSVKVGYNKVMQTPVIHNSDHPVWNTSCVLNLCHQLDAIEFRVKAAKRSGPLSILSKVTHLSSLSIPANQILECETIDGWFPLGATFKHKGADSDDDDDDDNDNNNHINTTRQDKANAQDCGEIHIKLEFTPVSKLESIQSLVVPHTYFPLRCNVNVRMYQNADCTPGSLPQIPFHPDFEHSRCWADIADAIMNTSDSGFIYITGWAVWPELKMLRTDHDNPDYRDITLGEMLKQKAEQGVLVCVMVWDELASNTMYNGLMGTHDEEVISYFRRSKVHAIKVGRQNPKDGPLADLNDAMIFTHHQKTVIVSKGDSDSDKQRIEAWVGGLDLTDGRYDNQDHTLFRSLQGVHAPPDFWQACTTVSATSGPREPWHDIHAHVTGTAAWDILTNFEGRWTRQAPKQLISVLHQHDEDSFVQPKEENEREEGNWNVQVLRSINESSSKLMSSRPGLIRRRSAATDQSIHNAYIHYIRNAKQFIYIENQYFIGSSHLWDSGQRGGFASNLIPIELAEKICAKIRANERFMVYVNIPMFPEGPPDSGAVQEILSHQRKSINLITSRIKKTLKETESETKIEDWFNVFCLANRESLENNQGDGGSTNIEKKLSKSRRFMVYIHSKFAIFDDTVAIIGSANINSRSMDGSRDTEIAIAAWQPEHVATGHTGFQRDVEEEMEVNEDGTIGILPKGDVAAFRASIWSQHLGEYMEEFESPASMQCVEKVREMANANWEHFAEELDSAEQILDMPHGHLALYPYVFDEETGEITSRQTNFPDFEALVKGKASPGMPNMLTG